MLGGVVACGEVPTIDDVAGEVGAEMADDVMEEREEREERVEAERVEAVAAFSWATLHRSPKIASFLHFVWTVYWHSVHIYPCLRRPHTKYLQYEHQVSEVK
jgi:hypothetical protein